MLIQHSDEFRSGVMLTFHYLESYLNVIEQQLEEAQCLAKFNLATDHEPIVANSDEEASEKFAEYDVARDVHERLHLEVYPQILGYSVVVHLFMLVETQLTRLCDEIARRESLNLRARDLQGPVLERTKKYLAKLASVIIADSPAWQRVRDLQMLRDSILHCGGELERSNDKDKGRIKQIINDKVGVSEPDAEGRIRVRIIYCRTALAAIQQFFSEVFDATHFGPST